MSIVHQQPLIGSLSDSTISSTGELSAIFDTAPTEAPAAPNCYQIFSPVYWVHPLSGHSSSSRLEQSPDTSHVQLSDDLNT